MILPEEEAALDLDWFALDAQGSVGHFTTGGCGALPRSAAACSLAELSGVREYVRTLPETGASILNREWVTSIRLFPAAASAPPGEFRDWAASAARGLYAFEYIEDRRRRPRPYRVVARPEVPIKADELPPEIRSIVERTHLKDIVFARDDLIGMASLL